MIDIKRLTARVYLLNELDKATGYVVGGRRAAVIDTMIGLSNTRKAVRSITAFPIIVLNTHGHADHVYGNAQQAYRARGIVKSALQSGKRDT